MMDRKSYLCDDFIFDRCEIMGLFIAPGNLKSNFYGGENNTKFLW